MDTFQGPSLPLPMIYRPPISWKISILIIYFVSILLLLVVFVASIILFSVGLNPLNINVVLLATFMVLTILSIILGVSFYSMNQLCLRLELRPQGVIYSAFGQRLYTPWSNISSYDLLGSSKIIILREGAIRGSLEEGLQRHIAAHETTRWLTPWWLGRAPTRILPVPHVLWNFENTSVDFRFFSRYLQKYAPQASQI